MSQTGDPARPQPTARAPFIERLAGAIAVLGGLLLLTMAGLVVVERHRPALLQFARSMATSNWSAWAPPSPSSRSCPTARHGAATSWLIRSRVGCRARTNALIDAFWDLVYAGHDGLPGGLPDRRQLSSIIRSGQTTMLLQLTVWPAIAMSAALMVLLTVRRPGDGSAGCCGARHERAHVGVHRLRRHAAADRAAHADRPVDAGRRARSASCTSRAGRRSSPT